MNDERRRVLCGVTHCVRPTSSLWEIFGLKDAHTRVIFLHTRSRGTDLLTTRGDNASIIERCVYVVGSNGNNTLWGPTIPLSRRRRRRRR